MKCEVCDADVSSLFYPSHVRHCRQRYYRCELEGCCELVHVTEREVHIKLNHTDSYCEKCGGAYRGDSSVHDAVCEHRIKECIYCMEAMEWYILRDEHESQCGNQTVNCSVCDELMTRNVLRRHCKTRHELDGERLQSAMLWSHRKIAKSE
jgi:hypothetical protein